jgi:hypothetical protein
MGLVVELISNVVLIIFSAGCLLFSIKLAVSSSHPFLIGPGVFPTFVTSIIFLLSLTWFFDLIMHTNIRNILSNIHAKESFSNSKHEIIKRLFLLISCIIYVVVLGHIGFRLATIIYLVGCLFYFGKLSIFKSIVLGTLISMLIYYFFRYALSLPLP